MKAKISVDEFMKNALPCPFCGGKDLSVTEERIFNELVEENGRACVSVTCYTCGAYKYDYTRGREGNSYSFRLKRLLDGWNGRVTADE